MRGFILATTAIVALVGCNPEIYEAHTDWDPHTQSRWTSVLAPMDAAGGERQTLLCRADYYGRLMNCWDGHAPGTLQGFMAGGFAGLMQAGGFAGGMALLRPSTTNVSNSNSNGGGYVAAGAASASASPTVTANPIATARSAGGAGGAGGSGGAGGAGGNATGGMGGSGGNATGGTASANPTISPTITAAGGAGGRANAQGGTSSAISTGSTANATNCVNPTQCGRVGP
jgi:hypothetical protein